MKRCLKCYFNYKSYNWTCSKCGNVPKSINGLPAFAPESAISSRGFKSEAFQELAKLETDNFWFQARNHLILWALRRHYPKMKRYLEIGCGTGFVLRSVRSSYPKASLAGSEILSAGLSFAFQRVPGAELIQMDARQIPYSNEFDVIGAFDVLEHIEEDMNVLFEINRALVIGGGLFITVPQHLWLWSGADEVACHVRRYQIGELRSKLERIGFRVEFETSFVSLLLPVMFALRFFKKVTSLEDAVAELQLPKIINRTFSVVMTLERGLIKAGLRFPFGGSSLLVARKIR
jgi:SAM-dependent methyltransferase